MLQASNALSVRMLRGERVERFCRRGLSSLISSATYAGRVGGSKLMMMPYELISAAKGKRH